MPESKKRKPKKGKRRAPPRRGPLSVVGPEPHAAARGGPSAVVPMRPTRDEARDAAQDLIYDAWEMRNKRDRVRLARQALEMWPDCADAYVILAQAVPGLGEARSLYEEGVAAGERAIGEPAFEKTVGHFWGELETRPYMRARAGLAVLMWRLGHREDAIEHYRELLRLCPSDNLGIRYSLTSSLLSLGRDEEASRLLEQPEYADDATANWAYARALVAYRRGESPDPLLAEALTRNPRVPDYLLGRRALPRKPPDTVGFGDDSEAVVCAMELKQAWRETPGALEWLEAESARLPARPRRTSTPPPAEVEEIDFDAMLEEDDEDEEEFLRAWDEFEAHAAKIVATALEELPESVCPQGELAAACRRLRENIPEWKPPYRALARSGGLPKGSLPEDDRELWLTLAAGTISAVDEPRLGDPEGEASWMALMHADWAGAILYLARSGPGTSADPHQLLAGIASVPEIEGDFDLEDEAPTASGFLTVLPMWEALGAVGSPLDDYPLTRLGHWGLPQALLSAWAHQSD